jgi:hypothetical protein
MTMKRFTGWVLGSVAVLGCLGGMARAGGNWAVGVSCGYPGCYRGCYGPGYYYRPYYYYPPPVVVAPAPVYVTPAPVVVQPSYAPPAYESVPAPMPRPLPTSVTQASATRNPDADRYLAQLGNSDEGIRIDSVMQLGRMRAERAIDPLAATLSGDRSANVRDAAAKALGLIGSQKALPALQQSAQSDSSYDVRRSAQYAIDVIQSR